MIIQLRGVCIQVKHCFEAGTALLSILSCPVNICGLSCCFSCFSCFTLPLLSYPIILSHHPVPAHPTHIHCMVRIDHAEDASSAFSTALHCAERANGVTAVPLLVQAAVEGAWHYLGKGRPESLIWCVRKEVREPERGAKHCVSK